MTAARMVARLAGPLPVRLVAASSPKVTSRTFSRGEDRCKAGVLADHAGSGVVIHPPSPHKVVVHVAGPAIGSHGARSRARPTWPACLIHWPTAVNRSSRPR